MKKRKRLVVILLILFMFIFCLYDRSKIGNEIDSFKNVDVYHNGLFYAQSYGENYSEDGYHFGYKWQCVEFVKRFYYQSKDHEMPELLGHAKDFFSYETEQGELNESRGLLQYYNGGDVAPEIDDLLVFTDRKYGHVAIITEVTENDIEVIQQNVYFKSRQRFPLTINNGQYFVGTKREPAGWLRMGYELSL